MTSIGLATVWTQLVRQKRQTSPEIALSRETAGNAGNAGNNSVNSHGKKSSPSAESRETAGNAGNAGNNSVSSHEKKSSTLSVESRETAGNAGNAGNISVNSHGKKQLPETLRNIYAERGNSPLHYQCSLQAEEQKIQQAKLGSGSMPLDDASGDADGLPADPQPAVPLSLSYVRGMNE